MPTVPPTCALVDSLPPPLSDTDLLASDVLAGPTPDPDTDDVALVSVYDGAAVIQDSAEQAPPPSIKPRNIELGALSFHSPSSIIGTPFDLSPRFEYPFPNTTCSTALVQGREPAFPSIPALGAPMPAYPAVFPTLPAALPLPMSTIAPKYKREGRSFSPTHLKLLPRDLPIPPGLAKKRRVSPKPSGDLVACSDADRGRARGGSISSLSDKFERLEKLRVRDSDEERNRSESVASRSKRHSLAICQGSQTLVGLQSNDKTRPPILHDSSLALHISNPFNPSDEYRSPSAPPRSSL